MCRDRDEGNIHSAAGPGSGNQETHIAYRKRSVSEILTTWKPNTLFESG